MVSEVTISSGKQTVTLTRTRDQIGRDLERLSNGQDPDGDDDAPIGNPHGPYPIPSDETFEDNGTEILPAFDLEQIGQRLIATRPELYFLQKYAVGYVWKRTGTVTNQKATYGTCKKANPELRHFAKVTWLVSISANFCRDSVFTNHQMEALVYHELNHCYELIDAKGNVKPTVIGHDLECFWSEYDRYGAWHPQLSVAERVFRQEQMGFDETEPDLAGETETATQRLSRMMGQHGQEAAGWINQS